jgi:hypothetical protein
VLEHGATLPEGTAVRVTAEQPAAQADAGCRTIGERLMKFAGALKGLPPDLARNHDDYCHRRL